MRLDRVLCVAPVLALACALSAPLAQTVKADYHQGTDFSRYKTFAFTKGTPAPTPFAQERIETAIASQLTLRGMTPAQGTADVQVFTHTQVSKQQRVDVTTFGYGGYPGWGGWGGGYGTSSVNVTEIPIGTVMVDLVDAKTNEMVWRGVASDTLLTNPTPEKSEKRINKGVTKLFTKYPVSIPKSK